MGTASVDAIFVDTNVLVYATHQSAPFHAEARQALDAYRAAGADMWISRQILREYIGVTTRPQVFLQPLTPAEVIADVRRFQGAFQIAEDSDLVMNRLLDLVNTVAVGGKQVYDANIVATMLVGNVVKLLTNNIADFGRFAAYISVVPLIPTSP